MVKVVYRARVERKCTSNDPKQRPSSRHLTLAFSFGFMYVCICPLASIPPPSLKQYTCMSRDHIELKRWMIIDESPDHALTHVPLAHDGLTCKLRMQATDRHSSYEICYGRQSRQNC